MAASKRTLVSTCTKQAMLVNLNVIINDETSKDANIIVANRDANIVSATSVVML